MKNLMILSGGTSTAWHIADVLKKYYADKIHLIIGDINPPYLVHTSAIADDYVRVKPIKNVDYYSSMIQIFDEKKIDILIPLIDEDIVLFSCDNNDLKMRNILSTTAESRVIRTLGNKAYLSKRLGEIGIRSPRALHDAAEIRQGETYFLKKAVGCGSQGAQLINSDQALSYIQNDAWSVQEVCTCPEITVDVVYDSGVVYTVCRERMQIKLGVSTKCRVFYDEEIQHIMETIAENIDLPNVFCVQFMKDYDGNWSLIDFNLRSGGGTAISAAVGFEAVRYAAAVWLGEERRTEWLRKPDVDRFVVRTYNEIVTK